MLRYMTPAKISLLALIQLYIQGAVTNDGLLPILSFILTHVSANHEPAGFSTTSTSWQKAESSVQILKSIKDFELILGTLPAGDGLPGRRLWDRFLDRLWAINTLHALQEFLDSCLNLTEKTKEETQQLPGQDVPPHSAILLSQNSPLGLFVRRSCLEFSRLSFHHAAELWQAYTRYRHPTSKYMRRRDPSHNNLSFDQVLVERQHEWGPSMPALVVAAYGRSSDEAEPPVSVDDIEAILEFQVGRMQKFGTRVPTKLNNQFRELLRDSLVIPTLAHYLSFLDAWKSGDYTTSFDSLYRYFDYTTQIRDRHFYQYALMNLAILHADFGCHKEAVDTMLETISTARENRDMTCLNFALNWLSHFGRNHPHLVQDIEQNNMLGEGKESLSFLRVRAREAGMWILSSSSLLSEAKIGLSSGDSLATCLEKMTRSSQIIAEQNTKVMMGSHLPMTMVVWDRLGLAHLSLVVCEIYLQCYASHCFFEDEAKVLCRLAGYLAGRGNCAAAFERLEKAGLSMLREWKSHEYCRKYRGLLKLRCDLRRNDLDLADHVLSQLLQVRLDDFEPDLAAIVDSLQVEALLRRCDLRSAEDKVNTMLSDTKEDSKDVALRIRLLLLKAHIFDLAGRSQKGFSIVVRAVALAWRARLLGLLWQSVGALANILTNLGEFAAARDLLLAILPRALECEAAFVAGTLYSFLADAYMGQAGQASTISTSRQGRNEFLHKAQEALDSAIYKFAAVEDVRQQCEMLGKKATIMRALGDFVLAEDYSARHLVRSRGHQSN